MGKKIGIYVITASMMLVMPIVSYAVETRTCKDGSTSHPATADEAASANKGGIVAGFTQLCPEDAVLGINAETGKAKEELNKMWCGGKAATCGPYTSSIQELDPKFAVCAAAFIAKVRAQDPSICIASAYRSSAHQAYLCGGRCGAVAGPCAPAGSSKHQQGIAIDIEKPNQNTLPAFVHQMARQGGGISFPVANDDGHMQPNGGDCSTAGYVAPDVPAPPGAQQTPLQNAMSAVRNLFTPPQPSPMAQALAQQPISAAQNPFSYASPTATTPTGTGSAGTSMSTSSSSGGTIANTTFSTSPISDMIGSGSAGASGSSTSAIDLIFAIANPTTTLTTASGTVVALNAGITNSVALQGGQQVVTSSDLANSKVSTLSPTGMQTFTSEDLNNSSAPAYAPTSNSTFGVLENLKQTLLVVLKWLTPFGAAAPRPLNANSTTAVME